jgi:protein required for attachment to host cells
MSETWIVAANRTDARILSHRRGGKIEELETFICTEARQPGRARVSDAPGRSHDRKGPARHAMEPHTDVAEQLARGFARQIAERVEKGRNENAWDELVLVSGDRFLGFLREALSSHCREKVVAEVHKNIVTEDVATIVAAMPETLQRRLKSGL